MRAIRINISRHVPIIVTWDQGDNVTNSPNIASRTMPNAILHSLVLRRFPALFTIYSIRARRAPIAPINSGNVRHFLDTYNIAIVIGTGIGTIYHGLTNSNTAGTFTNADGRG